MLRDFARTLPATILWWYLMAGCVMGLITLIYAAVTKAAIPSQYISRKSPSNFPVYFRGEKPAIKLFYVWRLMWLPLAWFCHCVYILAYPVRKLWQITIGNKLQVRREARRQRAHSAKVEAQIEKHMTRFHEILAKTGFSIDHPDFNGIPELIEEYTARDIDQKRDYVGAMIEGCDPDAEVNLLGWNIWDDGVFAMGDRFGFATALSPQTLAAWHLPRHGYPTIESCIARIRVDKVGLRAFKADGSQILYLDSCRLDPYRLGDDGSRVKNCCVVIEEYTDMELDWKDLHKFHWAEVTLQEDGTWQVEYDPEPAVYRNQSA
jgi:hypothetical protein